MRHRRISWSLATSLALCAMAHPQSGSGVTLTTKAVPVQQILTEVAKQTGLKLDGGLLRDWPVIVSVKEMSGKAFLDGLVKTLDAEWTKSGETFVLTRGTNRERIALAAEAELRASWLDKAIADYLKENGAAADWSPGAIDKRLKEDAERRSKMAEQVQGGASENMQISMFSSDSASPGAVILHEALRKIPTRTLGAIVPGQRVVWANLPNRMQKPLPYVPGTLDAFVRAYNQLLAANRTVADSVPAGVRVETPMTKRGEPITGIAKVIVAGERFAEGLQLTLFVVGARGEVLDRSQAYLAPPAIQPGTAPAGLSGEVAFSDLSRSLAKALQSQASSTDRMQFSINLGDSLSGSIGDEPKPPTLPKELVPIFADPVANEPMSYFVSEALLELAKKRERNLIAYAPDTLLGALANKAAGGKLALVDLYRIAPQVGLSIEEGDFLQVSPSNWALAARNRVSRTEFGRLVTSYAKRSYATLDEICRYALAMPRWDSDNLDAKWLAAYAPDLYARYERNQNVYLKLYGSLTMPQKQPAAERVIVAAMQMSSQQRSLLEEIVYQPSGPMIIGRGTVTMTTSVGGAPPTAEQPEPPIVQQEPTEAFPNGLPPNTRLEMRRRWADGVYAIDDSGRGRFLSAGDLGLRMGFDTSKLPPGMTLQANFSKYIPADLISIQMTVGFARRTRSSELLDASIRTGAAGGSYDQLPKPFRDNVDRARQRAMNMRTMGVGGRGVNIPPLP